MSFIVISTSLNPQSKSYILAREAHDRLAAAGEKVELLDLRKIKLPHCDGEAALEHRNVKRVRSRIAQANCIIVAVPVYNFSASSVAKNLVELTGEAWRDKTVGFLCAAGGKSGYMSVMGLVDSLMLELRCLVIPRFVYADGSAFVNGALNDQKISARVDELVRVSRKLAGINLSPPPTANPLPLSTVNLSSPPQVVEAAK